MKLVYLLFAMLFLLFSVVSAAQIEVIIPEGYESLINGDELIISINVINMGCQERIDVILNSIISNSDGDNILTQSETVAIETQANFVRTFTLPNNLPKGSYDVSVTLQEVDGSKTSASSTFYLVGDFQLSNAIKYLFLAIFIVVIFVLVLLFNKDKLKIFRLRRKISGIVKKRLKK